MLLALQLHRMYTVNRSRATSLSDEKTEAARA